MAVGDLSRVLGMDAPPAAEAAAQEAPASSRFQLVGVVAPRAVEAYAGGLALIAVDGKTARAYQVGSAVDGDTVLQQVTSRGAALGPRGQSANVKLDLPPLPSAATGVLPSVSGPSVNANANVPAGPAPAQRMLGVRPPMPVIPGSGMPPSQVPPALPADANVMMNNGPSQQTR